MAKKKPIEVMKKSVPIKSDYKNINENKEKTILGKLKTIIIPVVINVLSAVILAFLSYILAINNKQAINEFLNSPLNYNEDFEKGFSFYNNAQKTDICSDTINTFYEKAIFYFSKVINKTQAYYRPYYYRAMCYKELGDKIKNCEYKPFNISENNGNLIVTASENTNSAYFQDYYWASLADSNKTLDLIPNMAEEHYNRGWTYESLNYSNAAIEDFKKAISIYPTYLEAYKSLYFEYIEVNNGDEAVKILKQAKTNDFVIDTIAQYQVLYAKYKSTHKDVKAINVIDIANSKGVNGNELCQRIYSEYIREGNIEEAKIFFLQESKKGYKIKVIK
jgi:tetratricopeptide (TPR) repeat protein